MGPAAGSGEARGGGLGTARRAAWGQGSSQPQSCPSLWPGVTRRREPPLPQGVCSSERLFLGACTMCSDRSNPFSSWNGSTFPLGKGRLADSWSVSWQPIPTAPKWHLRHPEAWPGASMGHRQAFPPRPPPRYLRSQGSEAANAVVSSSFCSSDKAHTSGSLGGVTTGLSSPLSVGSIWEREPGAAGLEAWSWAGRPMPADRCPDWPMVGPT